MQYVVYVLIAILFVNALRATLKRKSFSKECDGNCEVCTCGKKDVLITKK